MNRAPRARFTVLLIEDDDGFRHLLERYLHEHGFNVLVCVSVQDAIKRLQRTHQQPNILVFNQVGQSLAQSLETGQRILQQGGLPADTAIVVIADGSEVEQEGRNLQVSGSQYVTHLENGQQLINLLQRLCLSSITLTIAIDSCASLLRLAWEVF